VFAITGCVTCENIYFIGERNFVLFEISSLFQDRQRERGRERERERSALFKDAAGFYNYTPSIVNERMSMVLIEWY
jgi:hypothetical protein